MLLCKGSFSIENYCAFIVFFFFLPLLLGKTNQRTPLEPWIVVKEKMLWMHKILLLTVYLKSVNVFYYIMNFLQSVITI